MERGGESGSGGITGGNARATTVGRTHGRDARATGGRGTGDDLYRGFADALNDDSHDDDFAEAPEDFLRWRLQSRTVAGGGVAGGRAGSCARRA